MYAKSPVSFLLVNECKKKGKKIFFCLIWLIEKGKRIEEKEKNKDPQLGMHV